MLKPFGQKFPFPLRRNPIELFYIGLTIYAVVLGFTLPNRNWDMLCYVGSVNAWQYSDPGQIYDTTMDAVRENVPDSIYTQYRQNFLSSTARAFVQQIPFCQVKPLYNASMWLLHQADVALPVASWAVSTLGFALLSFLVFQWRTHYLPHNIWLLMVLGLDFFWEWPMATLARFSTPDCLCTALTVATLFFWLRTRWFPGFCLLGWLAMLTRPDAMIPIGAFAAYFAFFAPVPFRCKLYQSTFLICLMLASYVIVNHLAGSYSYEHFFIYSFIQLNPYPAQMTQHLTWDMYWGVLSGWFVVLIRLERFITLVCMSLLAGWCYYKKPLAGNLLWLHLLGLSWACWALRFILWPSALDERFYYGYCLFILLSCGELITPLATDLWGKMPPHIRGILSPRAGGEAHSQWKGGI